MVLQLISTSTTSGAFKYLSQSPLFDTLLASRKFHREDLSYHLVTIPPTPKMYGVCTLHSVQKQFIALTCFSDNGMPALRQ